MTSSLRSRFDFVDRRAVYVTGDKVAVYHWRNGALTDSLVFDIGGERQSAFEWQEEGGVAENFTVGSGASETALGEFDHYLKTVPNTPVYMLVDVVEEEYRQDTMPHVIGADRRALIERKLTRLIRGTPYHHAVVQGRETEGRRDDRVLLTALTNPDLLAPLIDLFGRNKVPLAGIYSLPILSGQLLPKLGAKDANVLLVTMHGASGLRQTFFRDQELKVSRLAKMPRLGTVPYAAHVLGELDKVRRYLNSLRLIARDAPLSVYILSSGDLLADLKEQCRDSDQLRYVLTDIADLGRRLGISGALTTPYSDALFAQLLLQNRPKNQYATRGDTSYYGLYRSRAALIGIAGLMLLSSSVWSGFQFIEGVSLRQQALDASQKAKFYEARYEIARQHLPTTPVPPESIARAVELVDTFGQYKATPLDLLLEVSKALQGFDTVQIDRIDWLASTNPEASVQGGKDVAPQDPGLVQQLGNLIAPRAQQAAANPSPAAYRYYHIAEIGGRIDPFTGDFRAALDTVNRLAESLRVRTGMQQVRVLALPLDISSSAKLQGSADEETKAQEAKFSLRVVMGVGNGQG